MREINVYLSTTCPSGGTYILLEYARRLAERKYDVRVYMNVFPEKVYTCSYKGKIHNCYFTRVLRAIKMYFISQKEIKNLNIRYPDIWVNIVWGLRSKKVKSAEIGLAGSWPASYMLANDHKTYKKIYLIQDYEDWDNYGGGKRSYLLSDVNKVVISSYINKKFKEELNIGPFPIIYNGLNLNSFHMVSNKKKNEDITIAMLYSFGARKGCNNGIKALYRARQVCPNIKIVMFGPEDRPMLDIDFEYCKNALPDKLKEIYNCADIYLWPSIGEGWGLTPIEAMACGCVVVGSDVASMSEIGKNNVNALLSEPGDVDQLTNNLIKLIQDKMLRERLSNKALEDVKKLDWNKSLDRLEEAIYHYNEMSILPQLGQEEE